MDVLESNASTEVPAVEGQPQGDLISSGMEVDESNVTEEKLTEVDFQKELQEMIAKGSLDFDTWTLLITEIEKNYPDDIETISSVYDSFLFKFPLCHVYWKKYAAHKIRLCSVAKAVEIFERAVESATYCVGLWVDYCSFSIDAYEDPFDIRRLFDRGMSFVGKDYLCHTLWDKYIEFEYSQHQWSFLLKILIQTLRFPTKKLHKYHDNFKKFAAILVEEEECQNDGSIEVHAEALPDGAVIISENEISSIIKDLENPSDESLRSQALEKYCFIGEQLYNKASQLDEKIHCFETSIRRNFFHVKPLDDNELANWHSYLDFIEKQEDFDWTVKLYERCLIPCANFPEFWMRYVEFMETKGGREIANFALERATQIFLEKAPVIHIFNARFREQIGDVYGARAAFLQGDADSNSYFVENVTKAANMEKRLGNLASASNIYEDALKLAAEKQKLHTVPVLYIHFSRLKYMIAGSADDAINVLIDGIQHVSHCRLLLEELIKFVMMHEGSKYIDAVDPIIANAISTDSDLSQDLSTKDREDLSCLYLEFIDLCGTNHDVRKAWNRHIKLFPRLIRTTTSYNTHPTSTNRLLNMAREARKGRPFALPNSTFKGCDSDHSIQAPVQEDELLPQNNHAIQPDQDVAEQSQPKEGDNSAQEGKQSGYEVSGAMEYGLGEFALDLVHQYEEAASGPKESTHEFDQPEGPIAPSEILQESSSSPQIQEIKKENKLEMHPSLSSQKESQDFIPMELQEHDVAQNAPLSDGNSLELGPGTEEILDTASLNSYPAKILNELDGNNSAKPSSSTSHQSPIQTQAELKREVPSNSGEEYCQDSSPEPHRHSRDLQQQDFSQHQCSTAEMGPEMKVSNDSWGGDHYQSGPGQGNVTASHAWPVSQYNNTQTSEQHGLIQQTQAYNQMLQYQQLQYQQQLLLQQQYQNQMLQMQQNPYFQQSMMFQNQNYLQQSQNLQAEQQQYLLYLQQQQQLLQMPQQLLPGQQQQSSQLEGQNQQGYQFLLQQYQLQQQQGYQQLMLQHQLQQQQQLQHQQPNQPARNQRRRSSNYQQGQELKPRRSRDVAGPSEPLLPTARSSKGGMLQAQNTGAPNHHQQSILGVPPSHRSGTSLSSPLNGDQFPTNH